MPRSRAKQLADHLSGKGRSHWQGDRAQRLRDEAELFLVKLREHELYVDLRRDDAKLEFHLDYPVVVGCVNSSQNAALCAYRLCTNLRRDDKLRLHLDSSGFMIVLLYLRYIAKCRISRGRSARYSPSRYFVSRSRAVIITRLTQKNTRRILYAAYHFRRRFPSLQI